MRNKSFDIVFVMPSMATELRQESIGTLILAQKALESNYEVAIVRLWEVRKINYSSFANVICDRILSYIPKIVSFYCRASEYHILIDLAKRIKEIAPGTKIVFGGPQAELTAEETLKFFSCIDYICCGEGENTIVPLLDMILKNHNFTEQRIPGLVYRIKDQSVSKNPLPELLPDNYTRDYLYYDLIPKNIIINSKSVTIDVGRGCPFSCTFCSTKTFWKQKYRLRDLSNTLFEIDFVVKHFGNKLFSFSHDLFTVNKNRVLDFCSKVQKLGYQIKWTCSARIDCIDESLIEKMASAGLVGIYYGIESGSDRMQNIINKHLNIQRCLEIVQHSIKNKIYVTTSFIYGFPEETDDDLNKTLELIHQLMIIGANVQLHYLTFERGSKLYESYKHKLSYSCLEQNSVFGGKELSQEIQQYPELFSTFWNYSSPLRNEMKFLNTFHSIGREYQETYILLISLLTKKGLSYVEAYKLIFAFIQDSLVRFERDNVEIKKSICYFLFEKIIFKLSTHSGISTTKIETSQLKASLLNSK